MIVYDDMEAGLKAQQQIDNITRKFGSGDEVDVRFWKYDFLGENRLWEQAVVDAEEAHLILFSMSSSLILPTRIMRWVSRWREAGVIDDTSFAILTNSHCRNHSLVQMVRRYLQQAARMQETRFFKGCFSGRQSVSSVTSRPATTARSGSDRGRRYSSA